MPSKEIEYKIQITEVQIKTLKRWLTQNAKFIRQKHQIDYYLEHPQIPLTFINRKGFKDAVDYFRVRIDDSADSPQAYGDSVCLKHFHKDKAGNYTHCDEYETKIKSGKELLSLFKYMGFKESVVIDKIRKVYEHQKFEIGIDCVKNLGNFVEIELKKDVANVSEGHELIEKLLLEMGIDKFRKQSRGYVSMVWNKGYDFGERLVLKRKNKNADQT